MSLETHIAAAEDRVLDSLLFAGELCHRSTQRFVRTAGRERLHPPGIRLMRFNLADQNGWLEGHTLRLVMTIHNSNANDLIPICDSPASMFRLVRAVGNGSAMISDIQEHGRVHEMLSRLQSAARCYNAHAEGWGSSDLHNATFNSPGDPDPTPGNSAAHGRDQAARPGPDTGQLGGARFTNTPLFRRGFFSVASPPCPRRPTGPS
jgi:hypothetical protein